MLDSGASRTLQTLKRGAPTSAALDRPLLRRDLKPRIRAAASRTSFSAVSSPTLTTASSRRRSSGDLGLAFRFSIPQVMGSSRKDCSL